MDADDGHGREFLLETVVGQRGTTILTVGSNCRFIASGVGSPGPLGVFGCNGLIREVGEMWPTLRMTGVRGENGREGPEDGVSGRWRERLTGV